MHIATLGGRLCDVTHIGAQNGDRFIHRYYENSGFPQGMMFVGTELSIKDSPSLGTSRECLESRLVSVMSTGLQPDGRLCPPRLAR